jgi:DNA-binding beta-propeller fold protein YncE
MNRLANVVVCAALLALSAAACNPESEAVEAPAGLPVFQVEANWLPPSWIMGPVTGIAVDGRDHVWVGFRERGGHLAERPNQEVPVVECCVPAPILIELDADGKELQRWRARAEVPNWPEMLHGLFVDHNDFIWFAARDQHQVFKFRRDGSHVLTIGRFGETGGSNDTERLGRPAAVFVDPETNELYVADGYANRRVIVFDAETGVYKRHWGAYGERPDDEYRREQGENAPPSRQFSTPHGVKVSRDGLVYVADRGNERVQVFRRDGQFVMEGLFAPAIDVVLSRDPQETYLYVADGNNHKVWVLRRADLQVVGEFGQQGDAPGQFQRPHNMSIDSRGNLFVGEQADQSDGRRVQKLGFTGFVGAPAPAGSP